MAVSFLTNFSKFKLNGFVDLALRSAAAGFKQQARNMTTLGVQVIGTVSTGDDLFGMIFLLVYRCMGLEISDLDISVSLF